MYVSYCFRSHRNTGSVARQADSSRNTSKRLDLIFLLLVITLVIMTNDKLNTSSIMKLKK